MYSFQHMGIWAIENFLEVKSLEGKLMIRIHGFLGTHMIIQSYGVLPRFIYWLSLLILVF